LKPNLNERWVVIEELKICVKSNQVWQHRTGV
jgi:hypothetical protein